MIGTGVFTSLGYQVVDIKSGFSIILLWVLGGIVAFCGAVCYAELGSVFRRSGGEYQLLSKLYHPALGFVAGWVSVTVGFAAPAAIAAIALSSYLSVLIQDLPQDHVAACVVLTFALIHGSSLKVGSFVQNLTTILKVVLILVFLGCGLFVLQSTGVSFSPEPSSLKELISAPFAVSLIYVSYAYTGWNSSIYISDEMKEIKYLPLSLFIGTAIVTVLYILLNATFLHTVPIERLAGQIEVAFLSADVIFGSTGGQIMGAAIAFLLLSTVSAYVYIGPRVSQVMGEDFVQLRSLSRKSKKGIPVNAFVFSTLLSLLFIYTSSFEQVVVYTSFLLILITTIAVFGVFILRLKKLQGSYKAWGYPITPIIFILVSVWTLVFVAIDKPLESLVSLSILLLGLLVYFVASRKS